MLLTLARLFRFDLAQRECRVVKSNEHAARVVRHCHETESAVEVASRVVYWVDSDKSGGHMRSRFYSLANRFRHEITSQSLPLVSRIYGETRQQDDSYLIPR